MRDVHGNIMRFVRVYRDEHTCLLCGETTGEDYCPRCSDFSEGVIVRDLIPTLSYLHEDEFVPVQ